MYSQSKLTEMMISPNIVNITGVIARFAMSEGMNMLNKNRATLAHLPSATLRAVILQIGTVLSKPNTSVLKAKVQVENLETQAQPEVQAQPEAQAAVEAEAQPEAQVQPEAQAEVQAKEEAQPKASEEKTQSESKEKKSETNNSTFSRSAYWSAVGVVTGGSVYLGKNLLEKDVQNDQKQVEEVQKPVEQKQAEEVQAPAELTEGKVQEIGKENAAQNPIETKGFFREKIELISSFFQAAFNLLRNAFRYVFGV